MVLLGGVETVSGAVIGAIVYKALNIWLVSQTDLSKLVLGGFIVLIVVVFPKGIVGTLEMLAQRRRKTSPPGSPCLPSRSSPPNERRPPLLAVEGLTKSYGGVHAVRGVSFSLRAGEILALIGPNGAGKSTCFDMLNGQNRPDTGHVRLLGRGHHRQEAARDLAARRRPHLPDHRDLRDHDRARERAGRADLASPAAVQSLGLGAAFDAREAGRCSSWSAWAARRIGPAASLPMATSSGSSLPSRSPTSPNCC